MGSDRVLEHFLALKTIFKIWDIFDFFNGVGELEN
jgi:hypothetical protein